MTDAGDQPQFTAAVIGAAGAIGAAIVRELESRIAGARVIGLSRPGEAQRSLGHLPIDITAEDSIAAAAAEVAAISSALDLVLVTTGILHGADLRPEKTWRSLSRNSMERAFLVNAIGPALVGSAFLPLLARNRRVVFAALSARVGSIGDNALGGWHSYRASKAALNMLVRNFSIELAARNRQGICVALHPGTVDSPLSRPFHKGMAEQQVMTPERSARCLVDVIERLRVEDSGRFVDWKGEILPY
jgi:NAD(P)-dependent dehydrogenase (short-subunit alcohol dehydrogenase family)